MEELVRQISQRTGITEEQARMAVKEVIAFIKPRLPAPFGDHLESLLATGDQGGAGAGDFGNLEDIGKGLGDMFGRK